MTEKQKNELLQYIEKLNAAQLHIVLGFVKKLLHLHD